MIDTIIISGLVGFLLGGIVVAVGVCKTFCDAWDTAWNNGYRYGVTDMETIMTDRESVIATLQHCASAGPCTGQKFKLCPYRRYDNCAKQMAQDMLEMLKEQKERDEDA